MQANARSEQRGELRLRTRALRWGRRTYIMGIVNVTPDSFSGDGIECAQEAVRYAMEQHRRSSDILDIGAESTRPGHQPIDARLELARLIPVVATTRERLPDAPISVDTQKPEVFREALLAGADMLNCVWGMPPGLLEAAAEAGAPVVIMHNKHEARYGGEVMDEVLSFLSEAAERAVRAGLPAEHVLLDPGIGFGKTAEMNVRVLAQLPRLCQLGFPTLLGASRKSTIGKLTGREPRDRVYGTAATTALAIAAGIDVVRVHDVAEARDVVRVADAIVRGWRPDDWT